MKDLYVILAFHAHELLWDLPGKLLSYLEDENPMKETILDENYIKKEKKKAATSTPWASSWAKGSMRPSA